MTCYILVAMANNRYKFLWFILGNFPFRVLELYNGSCVKKGKEWVWGEGGHRSAEVGAS